MGSAGNTRIANSAQEQNTALYSHVDSFLSGKICQLTHPTETCRWKENADNPCLCRPPPTLTHLAQSCSAPSTARRNRWQYYFCVIRWLITARIIGLIVRIVSLAQPWKNLLSQVQQLFGKPDQRGNCEGTRKRCSGPSGGVSPLPGQLPSFQEEEASTEEGRVRMVERQLSTSDPIPIKKVAMESSSDKISVSGSECQGKPSLSRSFEESSRPRSS